MKARRGQVALYLVGVLVALTILVVMNVDVFVAVRAKNRVENGGDAAALAAARVQGDLLNRIGRLNVEHILAAVRGDAERCEAIVMQQRRLALLGPVDGLIRANEAAQANDMPVNDGFSALLREHVFVVRNVYAHGTNANGEPYPEPWPGAWEEYATALEVAIGGGLAVGPDNCEFYDARAGHPLLDKMFYEAIASRNWCWFKFNALSTLENYGDYHYWGGGLPAVASNPYDDCEVFSLHVRSRQCPLFDLFKSASELAALIEPYLETPLSAADLREAELLADPEQVWFLYDPGTWRTWHEISPFGEAQFPVLGEVKPEYDVHGAASVCRCKRDGYVWTAAAKPFGALAGEEGLQTANAANGFVLPCFDAVRLVPLDAVAGADLETADYDWVTHTRRHLGKYLQDGPFASSCFYCQQLLRWENAGFRKAGVTWLKFHGRECTRGSGGVSGHGGTRHGH